MLPNTDVTIVTQHGELRERAAFCTTSKQHMHLTNKLSSFSNFETL